MQHQLVNLNVKIIGFLLTYVIAVFGVLGSASLSASETLSGDWVNKEYRIKGSWTVEQRDGQTVISFDKAFKTKKGPDLKVFLSKKTIDEATGKNATVDSVLVAALKKNKGKQEYVLPAGVDINDYESLLIHCEAYSVLWGGGAL